MKLFYYFVLLAFITTFSAFGQTTTGLPAPSVASGGAVAQSCVGNPGNTTGKYLSQCQASTGAVYACNNATGCSVAADWAGSGNVTGPGSSVNGDLACFNGVTGALLSDCGILPSTLAPLASPTFTGTPSAPTATAGTSSTQLATTAFVQTAIGSPCYLSKYTVAYNNSSLNVSSALPTVALATLASTSTRICLVEISGTTSFTGISNLTAATVRLQSGAGTPLLYSPNQDIFGTVGAATNNYWTDAGNTADRTNQSVVAVFTFTCSSGNCYGSGLTAGSVNITIGTRTMP